MRAVLYRLRAALRSRPGASVGLAMIIAVITAVVLASAAGARRTSTAPDRYTATFRPFTLWEVVQTSGPSRASEVASLPAVASVEALTFVFGGVSPAGSTDRSNALVLAGSYVAAGRHLVRGRAADPGRSEEFVASPEFVDAEHAWLGDRFDLTTLSQEQADSEGFFAANPAGPRLTGVLVGVVDGPSALDDATPAVVFSAALLGERDLGVSQTMMAVGLRPGASSDELRTELDTLPQGQQLAVQSQDLIGSPLRRAVDAQARGLWLLAAAAALAAIAVLGQVISRHVRISGAERERLAAIGFTDRQVLAESAGRGAGLVIAGCTVGAALAVLASSIFPSGFVRRLEPHPGLHADLTVLALGGAVLVAALVLWTVCSLAAGRRSQRQHQPSPIVEAIARRTSPPSAIGARFAFTRRWQSSGSMRSSFVGLVLVVAGLVGAVTFGVSLRRLGADPPSWGSNYDYLIGDAGAQSLPDDLLQQLQNDPDVESLMLYSSDTARSGAHTLELLGMETVRGKGAPLTTAGRLPSGQDEVALGRVTARAVGLSVGDEIMLTGPSGSYRFHVSGLAIVPGVAANDGMGEGAIVTMDGLRRLDPGATVAAAAVQLRAGASDALVQQSLAFGSPPDGPIRPPAIANVTRIRTVPFLLAGLLAALALLTVAHVLLTSLRSRQRDLAVLRSLGADRSWITRAMHWQATWFTLPAVAIAIPVGFFAGKLVYVRFADSMGALNTTAIPVALVALTLAGLLLLANLATEVPARRARRTLPALTLQTE